MRLLLVEDELGLQDTLKRRFEAEGYAMETASDGRDGLYLASEYEFDAAIVDLGLPELSGMELIRQLRQSGSRLPILALTARSSWQDKVEGLQAGADDYVVKPFNTEELLARINALVRRAAGHAQPTIQRGGVTLDTTAQRVTCNGQEIELTGYEYKVLEYLLLHAGKVVSKMTLTEHIYAQDFDRESNVIEVFVARLRKKLEACGESNVIETLRGRGYRISADAPTG